MTPFKYGRPSRDWNKSFVNRNSNIIQRRTDTSLETYRAKLTKYKVNKWYSNYRDLVANLCVLENSKRIFNADETGVSLGSKTGNIIVPLKKKSTSATCK